MTTRGQVQDKDKGFKGLLRRIGTAKAGKKALLVGIQGPEAAAVHGDESEDEAPAAGGQPKEKKPPATVGEIAGFHELGLGVPERSWLRGWFDSHRTEILEDLRKVTRGVLEGRFTQEQGMEILGVKYVGQIQARMATSIPPPNAPSTVARKGSSTTLIDTGQMRSAVTYVLALARAATPGAT